MTQKRILVLNGHPAETSLNKHLAVQYADAAKAAGHDVRMLHIHDMAFDADYGFGGYKQNKPLEPVLEQFLEDLKWAGHVVIVSPMWWGGLPAKLKGLIDRTFLPGIVFDSRGKGLPKPLLTGRSARVILTSDSPWWYFRFFLHRPLFWQLRKQILEFVGLKPARVIHFAQASHPTDKQVEKWEHAVAALGHRGE
ncbi:Putative NADPH-quinone reductase (modulator of drug activity B) [Aliiroseovarius halocynthiae]|uniref:NAD(P)H-dependent oxidoreductase n=1 Tax=Aliiroseovarius halocynthiae TaxID=985055 RepID=A0A545SUB5_9RHOB|nr:NAD(P)H-dependent oxidoreductase [Aliiroseovarius halocynthiae]TQV68556.1 NAD(P)H-dependent oxidoreductase [Aliiroseovarius halocynthiae]SMR70961.1 Putative NADPH-quinone reductase (modulator of drug activity B) [Aliiroseovarius halocynthiae]